MQVPDKYSHLDRHDLDSGGKGDWTKELHRPEPNSVYVVDDRHLFVTDDHGRVVHLGSTLDTTPGERNSYQQKVAGREYRLEIDQGGHLIATGSAAPARASTWCRCRRNSTPPARTTGTPWTRLGETAGQEPIHRDQGQDRHPLPGAIEAAGRIRG